MDVREYSFPVTTYVDFDLDFDKVYSYIKNKYPELDNDDIYNEFGDNLEYYILECGELTDEEKEMLRNANGQEYDEFLDDVWDDFERYLNEIEKQ